jgi:endonuclease/exonuclease/phosphatase family metal-dependent hydrolase
LTLSFLVATMPVVKMDIIKHEGWTGRIVGLAGLLLLGVAGCVSPAAERLPGAFRLMTYNIRHGEGMDGRIDLERIAEVIRREGADVVALQEVDRGVTRSGRRDLAGELAALTGMTCVFSNNFHFQGGEYGNALLTRTTVGGWRNTHYRMLREGEQRGLLWVELEMDGRRLVVMNTHLDFRPDDAERLSNVQEIMVAAGAKEADGLIICGDFNSEPGSPTHDAMKERFEDAWEAVGLGEGFTYSSTEPNRRIDYVFWDRAGKVMPVRAWVSPSLASDHLPLTVEFEWR